MEAEVWGRAIHGEKTIMYKDRLRDTRKLTMFSKLFLMWCSRNKVDQWEMTQSRWKGSNTAQWRALAQPECWDLDSMGWITLSSTLISSSVRWE